VADHGCAPRLSLVIPAQARIQFLLWFSSSFPHAFSGNPAHLLLSSSFRRLSTAEWLVKPESSVFALSLVIPAEAGIQPLLWLLILSDRVPSFFRSHPCERVTFLCLHKEK
jgi:hypothetical protein